jgi:hypothetical protein
VIDGAPDGRADLEGSLGRLAELEREIPHARLRSRMSVPCSRAARSA